MRRRSWALVSGFTLPVFLPVFLAACASASLDAPPSDGIVVVEARVVVKCLNTGYVNQAALSRSEALPLWNEAAPPLRLVRGGRGGGRGGDGYDPYWEPPCDDSPARFAPATNVAERVWLDHADRQLSGERHDGLLIVRGVPPGDWRVESLVLNFSFGGYVYVARLPGPNHRSVHLPETVVHVAAGQVTYAGVLTILATRDVNRNDTFSVSDQYDPAAELSAWKRLLPLYAGTPWEAVIRTKAAQLEH